MRKLLGIGLALGAATFSGPAALAATTTVHAGATAGTVAKSPRTAASARARTAASPQVDRGARRIPRRQAAAAAPSTAVPRAQASVFAAAPGSLLANFNGVGSRDSEVTNFGLEFEPPDQGLCVGNGYVVEMVNTAYRVYRPNGTTIAGPFNANGPFNKGLLEFSTDPRCHYDPATNTWFATMAFISDDSTQGTIDIAVNTSGDPRTPWTNYEIDATSLHQRGHAGCPCFGDQPTLGIDQHNLYITTNEFSILGPEFNGAQVYALAKSDLVGLEPDLHFVHFDNLNIGGAPAASIQPALTNGSPGAEFFLNALDPNGTFDQRIGVWALTNRNRVAQGQIPKLSSVVIGSEAYGLPPLAEQKGSDSLLDGGDDRMQQTQFISGNIWGALGTAVTIPGDNATRAGGAWFQVKPVLSGSVLGSAQMLKQGYVAARGTHVLFPAIQVSPSGTAVMVHSVSSRNRYPSAAYSLLPRGSSSFGPIQVAATGTGPYAADATRWGDYSWAVLDPSGGSIWGATEYIPPKASQTTDGSRNWGTRVFQVATP